MIRDHAAHAVHTGKKTERKRNKVSGTDGMCGPAMQEGCGSKHTGARVFGPGLWRLGPLQRKAELCPCAGPRISRAPGPHPATQSRKDVSDVLK